jgi:hypothetical protein
MNGTIGIGAAYADLKATAGSSHRLQFVYGEGKRQGEIGELLNCTYGVGKNENPKSKNATAQPRKSAIWKEKGTVPIVDLDSGKLKTLLISHLRMYDGYLIKH